MTRTVEAPQTVTYQGETISVGDRWYLFGKHTTITAVTSRRENGIAVPYVLAVPDGRPPKACYWLSAKTLVRRGVRSEA